MRLALDCNPSDDDNRSLVQHGTPERGLVQAIFPHGIDLFKGAGQTDGQVLHHLFWLFCFHHQGINMNKCWEAGGNGARRAGISSLLGAAAFLALALPLSSQAAISFKSDSACFDSDGNVSSLADAFSCGKVSGSARALYYTTHNAYFAKGFNQDTISYGGFVKYETAPLYGFNIGVSGLFLRGINHPPEERVIGDIGDNQTNIGEAWLSWRYGDFRITGGNQRLDLPFVGDYDWRITPILYQAVDMQYGSGDDFLRATKIWRYKGWGSDRVKRTTAYTEVDEKTDGMWAIGAGHHLMWDDKKLTGQMWYESYDDFSNIFYTEGHIQWQQAPLSPDFGLQFIRGTSEGKALAGDVDNRSFGAQLALSLTPGLSWAMGYDHIAASGNSYGYGSLVTPYAHNTASGPYFAQPYFTSTQDLGSGNAWATSLNWQASESLTMGARYSWMDLTPSVDSGSLRQSEYLLYFIWNFQGALKGLSLTDFVGVQTSPLYEKDFWQNRLTLQYDF